MAQEHKLEITTATIQIKVIHVDNHKMTKATFNQIECNHEDHIKIKDILGWVNDSNQCIIFWFDRMSHRLYRRSLRDCSLEGNLYMKNAEKGFDNYESYKEWRGDQRLKSIRFVKHNFDQLFIAT